MELNYKSFGQGEPILIMHGMFGMLDNWQWMARQLSKEYMVFLVDLRNHGKSPHSDEFSYHIMAEDIHQFMEDNWLHEATIVGHSMGGKVAMRFALEYPDMVDRLVVVDMAPKTYEGNHDSILKALQSFPIDQVENRTEAQEILSQSIPQMDVVQFLLKNLRRDRETGGYRWKMNLPVIIDHYEEILGHEDSDLVYEGPTLFLAGDQSDYVKADEFPAYKKNFPEAKLTYIKGAGHWVHAEAPETFLKHLMDFMKI
jgi:esterase